MRQGVKEQSNTYTEGKCDAVTTNFLQVNKKVTMTVKSNCRFMFLLKNKRHYLQIIDDSTENPDSIGQ